MILDNTIISLLICNGRHLTITVITRLFRGRRRSSRKSLGLEDEVDLKVPPFGGFPDLLMITFNLMLLLTEKDDDGSKVILEKNIFCMQPKSGALGATVRRITSHCDHNAEIQN